ncbi:MAG: hypothetical protein DRI61_12440 [Chloroflexi bacterium]|nr:MAG: hypothetical protein DRI61_12440 [Chloroflexota bacterium]
MEELAIEYVEGFGRVTFLLICLSAVAGVLYHIWLTRNLVFVDFGEHRPAKKEVVRLLLPMILVLLVSAFLPLIMVGTSPDLNSYLEDPSVSIYVGFPWKWILPARDWKITYITDAILGGIIYWFVGLVIWLITKPKGG